MRFTFLRIPVQIAPTFWLFLLLFTNFYREFSLGSLVVGGIMFISLLVHEYGHALTAMHFGAETRINLEWFGGGAQYNPYAVSAKQRFFITLNGPLFESLLIFIPYFFLKVGAFTSFPYVEGVLYMTMKLNIMWCLLNLIPILPLDGGQLLLYFLERKFADRGYKIGLIVGLLSLVPATIYFYSAGYHFFAIMLLMLGVQNVQMLRQFKARVKPVSDPKKLLKRLLKSQDVQVKHSAIESLAKTYFEEGKFQKSYELLSGIDAKVLREGKVLLCKLAFLKGSYEVIEKYAMDIYEISPSYEIAILNSKAFACLKQPYYAGAWLETAAQFSPDHRQQAESLLDDPVYEPVREDPIFKESIGKLRSLVF